MALNAIQYVTTSQREEIKGLRFPLRSDSGGGFFTSISNEEAVKNNIRQLLLTNPGERVMQPKFGLGLRRYVMEPLDAALLETIRGQISDAIRAYEPRVIVKRLDVSPRAEQSGITVRLTLVLKGDQFTAETMEVIV
mgnify:CR=1 FL=1